ncbi:vacuolar sorting protein 39 domain 2 domain-containing protein [Phthorimaea operculella]|nr:vacuolar sorting protein 39 domain 2 domain-containing protein [Phthorimaea operculella]
MHEAYEVQHLLNVTNQIESIAAYDDHLLLGTRQGHLLMYSVTQSNGNGKYELQLLRLHKNFSKKPIQQIDVIPEDNLLVCLTDNQLSTYDLNGVSFPLVKTFEKTKGASVFALDNKSTTSLTGESNSIVHLCVSVRRKLQVYYGKNGVFKEHLYEFTIPDVPKVMSWGQEYLCVGFKSEYTFYDLSSSSSGNPKEIFPISSSKSIEPTIAKYSDSCFILGRDNTSVLVEEGKDVVIKNTVKWSEPPVGILWDEPYILGLLQDQIIVQTVEPALFVQTLPELNKARLMYRDKLSEYQDQIIVQTVEPALFVQTLPELNKARLMYRCKRGLIFVSAMSQVWCVTSVDLAKQEQQLINDKQFSIAIDLITLSDCLPEEKKQKIHSIQLLYAHELFATKEYTLSMKEFMKLGTDPATVISLFPELDNKTDPSKKKLKGKDLENALSALIKYLTELRLKICNESKELEKTDGKSEASSSQREDGHSQRNIQQQLELIDTTLLKCYLQTNDALVASLLRLKNCRLDEAEKVLLQHGKHSELIILYQTKGKHTKALQLLKEQAKQPDSSLKGYHRTKTYLQHLGAEHINLIFEFSDWILKEHLEEGLKIFTEDISEVENLPRPKVLDYLLREHEPLVIPYLEHVIHTWNDNNPLFHDALVTCYREKITDKKGSLTEEELQHTKQKLLAFLEKSTLYTPERVILHFPNDSLFEERAVILGKLGRHEQALAIYVQILGDVNRAIRYCENVSQNRDDKNVDVYVILMRILMNPQHNVLTGPLANVPRHPTTAVPDLETALDILEKHADKISPLKALSVLPDSVPLGRLKHFLESALDSQLALKRRTQILKGLLYAEHLQVQELKQFHESKSVTINDYNVCPVCKKRFGNSFFVRYPYGDIVHYNCRTDK